VVQLEGGGVVVAWLGGGGGVEYDTVWRAKARELYHWGKLTHRWLDHLLRYVQR